ncbi:unnamed protein product, partial [Mesorhabditis spiculigera]
LEELIGVLFQPAGRRAPAAATFFDPLNMAPAIAAFRPAALFIHDAADEEEDNTQSDTDNKLADPRDARPTPPAAPPSCRRRSWRTSRQAILCLSMRTDPYSKLMGSAHQMGDPFAIGASESRERERREAMGGGATSALGADPASDAGDIDYEMGGPVLPDKPAAHRPRQLRQPVRRQPWKRAEERYKKRNGPGGEADLAAAADRGSTRMAEEAEADTPTTAPTAAADNDDGRWREEDRRRACEEDIWADSATSSITTSTMTTWTALLSPLSPDGGGKQQNGGGGGGPGAGAGGMHPAWASANRSRSASSGRTAVTARRRAARCGFRARAAASSRAKLIRRKTAALPTRSAARCACVARRAQPADEPLTEHLQKSFGTLPHE